MSRRWLFLGLATLLVVLTLRKSTRTNWQRPFTTINRMEYQATMVSPVVSLNNSVS